MLSIRREFASHRPLTQKQLAALADLGVTAETLVAAGAVRAARVHFRRDVYEPAQEGDRGTAVLLIPVYADETIIDICAVDPAPPHRFATRDGRAELLGEDDNRCLMGGALPVWRNPIHWLRAGCDGVVLLRTQSAWRLFFHMPRLLAEDFQHAEELNRRMKPPRWKGHVVLPAEAEEMAA